MKRKLCFLFVLPLLFTACENVLPIDFVEMDSEVQSQPQEEVYFKGIKLNTDFFVDKEMINRYCETSQHTRGGEMPEIIPLGFNEDVILFYVVNYDDGWEIIAADQRVPAVIAFCEEGSFNFNNAFLGEKIWLDAVAADVLAVRVTNEDTTRTIQAHNKNVQFWDAICSRKQKELTRPFGDDFPLIPMEPGRFVLKNTTHSSRYAYRIDHMVETKWGQGKPWNVYCPLKTDGSEDRVPAGCVAVAGAQMLYFLHNHFGTPKYAPSVAGVVGDADNYNMWQNTPDSLVWDGMAKRKRDDFWGDPIENDSTRLSATLIAHVGTLVGMDYGDDGSTVYSVELQDVFSSYYGIESEWGDFDEDRMWGTLTWGLPVYASAYRAENSILGIPIEYAGHAFLIDGHLGREYYTTYTYEWVPDDPNTPPARWWTYSEEVVTGADFVYIAINWGYNGDYDNDGNSAVWYLPDGDWQIEPYGEVRNYQYARRIMTDWAPIQN